MAVDAPEMEDAAGGRAGGLLVVERVRVKKSELAEFLGTAWTGEDVEVSRVAGIEDARPDSMVFAADATSLVRALESGAGIILSREEGDARLLRVADPRASFSEVYAHWFDTRGRGGVHATAVIEAGATIGANCEVGAGAFIAAGATVGDGCVLGARVNVLGGTTLGARVRVQAGAVLGSDGFGYARTGQGYLGFPQIGTLWIGDDVEVGANSTIDRGALGETRIGRGTKIDNLVHIAHNCTIGEDVIIAAQVGIAGSTTVGDGAILAGQVGLAEHVTIGPGVIVGAQGGVPTSKRLMGAGEVFWGTPARPIKEYLKDLARLKKR